MPQDPHFSPAGDCESESQCEHACSENNVLMAVWCACGFVLFVYLYIGEIKRINLHVSLITWLIICIARVCHLNILFVLEINLISQYRHAATPDR